MQGVLTSAATVWPHIHISDSLVMADTAVRMAEAGCEAIAVLGVDFMSENVRAILDEAGYTDVRVRVGACCAPCLLFGMRTQRLSAAEAHISCRSIAVGIH